MVFGKERPMQTGDFGQFEGGPLKLAMEIPDSVMKIGAGGVQVFLPAPNVGMVSGGVCLSADDAAERALAAIAAAI
jgi:hypothetical protein